MTEPSIPLTPFVASVMEQGAALTASITSAALESLQHENKRLKATLALIRERITDLAHEPMTPMLGHNMIEALDPHEADVNHYIKNILERP